MDITPDTSVAQIAAALPSSLRVFEAHGIDYCCGGGKSIGAACRDRGISFTTLVAAITASSAAASTDDRDWTRESLRDLTSHIVKAYHEPLRAELPRLQAMAAKVAQVHGPTAAHLLRVEEIVDELSDDLIAHVDKEELMVFPAIEAIESGRGAGSDVETLAKAMEQDHERAGELVAEMRRITTAYEVPEWSCSTFRALYRELQEFEKALHVHVHLENNVLFPRAVAQVRAAVA